MTGQGTMETAIEATKRGAFEYLLKPFEPVEMLRTVAKALEGARLMKGHLALGPETTPTAAEAVIAAATPCSRCTRPSAGWRRPRRRY